MPLIENAKPPPQVIRQGPAAATPAPSVYPHSSLEILLKEKTQDRNMTFFKFFEIRPEDIAGKRLGGAVYYAAAAAAAAVAAAAAFTQQA
eukprot:1159835-Pelagomonas_calceolata.AAC.2